MDYAQSLEFLKSLHPGKAVLYVPEIVVALGKSDVAVRRSIGRKALAVKKYAGRVGISLPDLAQFLADGDADAAEKSKPARKSKVASASAPSKPSRPIRGMASMISAIAAARLQANFFNELAVEMEKVQQRDREKRRNKNIPERGTGKQGGGRGGL
jgi:hypothetical protein